MGALTLTSLIPTIYTAMDTVSREQSGFIRAVGRDSNAERAALNETVMSPVVGAMTAENLNVGAYPADTPAQTINNVSMTISKSRSVPFGITGEENKGLNNAGTLGVINQGRIAQALRTLTNEVEADLAALHIYASRAYGTATGTPFGTAADLTDFAASKRILEENGAPQSDLHMVLDSASVMRLRGKQSTLFKVNEAGSDELLRTGAMGRVMDFDLHYSGAVKQAVTAGTAASATTDNAGYAVGSTTFTLASAGTGTLIAGDIITFAGDTNPYVVVSGDADVSGGGTLVIQEPGIKVAMSAATKAITVIAATTRNMFFYRGAIQLATRAPAMPDGGDSADDVMVVVDPVSGIAYEVPIRDSAIEGVYAAFYASDAVPAAVARACAELALRAIDGDLAEDLDIPVVAESIGPISVSYAPGGRQTKVYRAVDAMLSPFFKSAGGQLKVSRA